MVITVLHHFIMPATKLGQGNIFRSVCQEFCPQGEGQGVCMAGGVHGWGACVAGGKAGEHGRGCAWQGGMHDRGHALQGACVVGPCVPCTPPCQMLQLQHTVNERAVCILLGCIVVYLLVANMIDNFSETLIIFPSGCE